MTEAKSAGADYDIFIREGEVGMYWRHSDRGLSISDAGLRWSIEGRDRTEKLGDIESVHLMSAHVAKSGNVFNCIIRFKWGQPLILYSTNDWGSPDEERELVYRAAILDLHQRLAKSGNKDIVYRAGMTSGRHRLLLAVTIIATLLFGVLPLGLFLFVETSFHVFGVTAAGIAFIWPLWGQWQNNEPRTYFPDDLPYELIPG